MLRAICRHIPLATTFKPTESKGSLGLLLRTNLSFSWQYSLATVHDPASNVTNIVIFGLRGPEIKSFLESLTFVLRNQVPPLTSYHLIIPTLLMDTAIDAVSQDAEKRRGDLLQTYHATGLHGFNFVARKSSKHEVQLESNLLTKLTHNLTSLSDACAGIKAVCNMQFRFIDALRDFALIKSDGHAQDETILMCLQQLHFISQVLHGAESKLGYIKESAQCQVNTVRLTGLFFAYSGS
jgi:hypothetical protein